MLLRTMIGETHQWRDQPGILSQHDKDLDTPAMDVQCFTPAGYDMAAFPICAIRAEKEKMWGPPSKPGAFRCQDKGTRATLALIGGDARDVSGPLVGQEKHSKARACSSRSIGSRAPEKKQKMATGLNLGQVLRAVLAHKSNFSISGHGAPSPPSPPGV